MRYMNFWKKLKRILAKLFFWFFIISTGSVLLYRFVPVYFTPLMFIRSAEQLFKGESPLFSRDWEPIENISKYMPQAVIASEDNLFMMHSGFDLKSMKKAHAKNKKGKRIRGGSTISQQTAKNVFLFPQRSYIRKGLEAYFTVLIELLWPKERIMEVYLNVIETGDGIYGVEAAAQSYFRKSSANLSKSEAAGIAVCLPNPRKFNPTIKSSYISRRKSKIINLMSKIGTVDFSKGHKKKYRK